MKEHMEKEENTIDGLSGRGVISLLRNQVNFSEIAYPP